MNWIRILGLITLTVMAGCVREPAQTRSSTESHSTIVTTTATPDSQPSFVPVRPSPFGSVASSTIADSLTPVHFPSVRDSLCGEFAENGLLIPNTRRKAVAAQIGSQPDSTRSSPTPNPYTQSQTDSVVDVFYPGLHLHYIVLGKLAGDTDMLLTADVSDNRYLKHPALGVGVGTEVILGSFGDPEMRTNDTIRYSCALHIMSGATVDFHLDNDRVKSVEYIYDVD